MMSFLFLEEKILKIIGVDVKSFVVVGSFVIFFLALEMILGFTVFKNDAQYKTSILTLAFSVNAVQGTITSILSLRAECHIANIFITIFINAIIVYVILRSSRFIEQLLGNSGIIIVKKNSALYC